MLSYSQAKRSAVQYPSANLEQPVPGQEERLVSASSEWFPLPTFQFPPSVLQRLDYFSLKVQLESEGGPLMVQ